MPGLRRRSRSLLLVLAVSGLAALAVLPALAASSTRPLRQLRAWAFSVELLDDHNVLFQTSASNPGHLSLMKVLAGRGMTVPRALADESAQAQWGLTVAELAERGLTAGLPSTVIHVPARCLRRALTLLPLPVVTMWGTHFVVVESRPDAGGVTFVDPSLGRLRAPIEMLERYWRDVIVAFGDGKFSTDSVCTSEPIRSPASPRAAETQP